LKVFLSFVRQRSQPLQKALQFVRILVLVRVLVEDAGCWAEYRWTLLSWQPIQRRVLGRRLQRLSQPLPAASDAVPWQQSKVDKTDAFQNVKGRSQGLVDGGKNCLDGLWKQITRRRASADNLSTSTGNYTKKNIKI